MNFLFAGKFVSELPFNSESWNFLLRKVQLCGDRMYHLREMRGFGITQARYVAPREIMIMIRS